MPDDLVSHHPKFGDAFRAWCDPLAEPALRQLGDLAAFALHQEDLLLRGALRARDAAAAYGNVAPGLTYWLYETTLVYLVFRAWAPHHFVAWDYTPVSASDGDDRRSSPEGRRGSGRQQMDLAVTIDNQSWAFEAKWWNTPKSSASLADDAGRLDRWRRPDPGGRKAFLMAFWWSEGPLREQLPRELEQVDAWAGAHSCELRYRASFPTRGPEADRRFFVDVLQVGAK
jgi:hypothetical protein